jgi:Icc-related predicted phosphoesterase
MRVICISDTHGFHRQLELPDGDLLIHAGDITRRGELDILRDFNAWLCTLPHTEKVVIAGNHDFCFQDTPDEARQLMTACHYLEDSSCTIGGLSIYGTPWQPWFHDWAFNLERGSQLAAKWDLIPDTTDILVVHGPPHGHGDMTIRDEAVGCVELLERIRQVQPKLVVTGHIHEDFGITSEGPTTIVNASTCTLSYEPANAPLVIDL